MQIVASLGRIVLKMSRHGTLKVSSDVGTTRAGNSRFEFKSWDVGYVIIGNPLKLEVRLVRSHAL